jgi:DNA-binding PadR family transcriptional regulator
MARNEWPTPSEMIVLGILQSKPRGAYGLEIVAASDDAVKRGSVYVLLGRLAEKGFVRAIRSEVSPGYDGPPRPKYQLTAEGARVMSAAESIGIGLSGMRA